jgi:hypothetical protein
MAKEMNCDMHFIPLEFEWQTGRWFCPQCVEIEFNRSHEEDGIKASLDIQETDWEIVRKKSDFQEPLQGRQIGFQEDELCAIL